MSSHSITDRTIASGAVDSGSIPLESVMNLYVAGAVILGFCVVISIAAALRSAWERRQLKTDYYRAGQGGTRNTRIAFISDIHNYCDDEQKASKLKAAIKKSSPELILLGGDIVGVNKKCKAAPDVDSISQVMAELASTYPLICAEGNHDTRLRERYPKLYEQYRSSLEQAGVVFLIDEKADYKDICIYGVTLDKRYYRKRMPIIEADEKMPEKYLIGKLGMTDKHKFNILLMHSPMYLKQAADWGADLVLSGHFHGGTIRLPGGRGLMSPQFHFFNKYCSGEHHMDKAMMIVNRGLGTHTFNIRLNNLPELSIIDIVSRE